MELLAQRTEMEVVSISCHGHLPWYQQSLVESCQSCYHEGSPGFLADGHLARNIDHSAAHSAGRLAEPAVSNVAKSLSLVPVTPGHEEKPWKKSDYSSAIESVVSVAVAAAAAAVNLTGNMIQIAVGTNQG